jgi:hypothetical protein
VKRAQAIVTLRICLQKRHGRVLWGVVDHEDLGWQLDRLEDAIEEGGHLLALVERRNDDRNSRDQIVTP